MILEAITFIVPLVVLIIVLVSMLKILREYERGVVFMLGRFWSVKGPGLIIIIPILQEMVRVDLRTMVLDVPTQDVISRDNVSVKVNAVVYMRVVDPEKAIRAWNVYNPSAKIDTTEAGIAKSLKDDTAKMFLLSGQTHGSSFVGMVHLLKSEKSSSHQSTSSSSFDMEASFEENCWLAKSQGKFGVDGSFANSIKELLSSSNVSRHFSFDSHSLQFTKCSSISSTLNFSRYLLISIFLFCNMA